MGGWGHQVFSPKNKDTPLVPFKAQKRFPHFGHNIGSPACGGDDPSSDEKSL